MFTANKKLIRVVCYTVLLLLLAKGFTLVNEASEREVIMSSLASLSAYQDDHLDSVRAKLLFRSTIQPFNIIALVIFAFAILHTFMAYRIHSYAQKLKLENKKDGKEGDTFYIEIVSFLGEVEVIFGLWIIPLLITMTYYYNWSTAVDYLESRDYTEPLFVFVIMTLSATKPILKLAETLFHSIASLASGTVTAWWWTLLFAGPILGSLITEPAAMTISALLLAKQFYRFHPSQRLCYATLGLLFTNISVGGVLTNFAAPPVLMVSKVWNWDSVFMFTNFGVKAVLGILSANLIYYFIFRKELRMLEEKKQNKEMQSLYESVDEDDGPPIPFWISIVHMAFLAWIVVHSHHPVVFIGSFLLFLGFYRATLRYQSELELKTPILICFFLASLVVHGTLQAWWISPMLSNVSNHFLMILSVFLTAFNDNAAITFLASLTTSFDDTMKYVVVAGAVTGGGLTVIANAPNLTGQAILGRYFSGGVSTVKLFCAAIIPTIVMGLFFYFLKP